MSNIEGKNKIIRHARFEDGQLVLSSKNKNMEYRDNKSDDGKNLDYLFVLKALQEIPFGVGKKLLIDFLLGNRKNKSIVNNKLYLKKNFGSMVYEKDELTAMINNLIQNDMIELNSVNANKRWKMLELSVKGKKELEDPVLYRRKLAFNFRETETEITDEDRSLFEEFSDFLSKFNDEQKKAIISDKTHVLCIAGAGSGKTAVLTKKVEFLVKHRSIGPEKILAITFTRKARREMMTRLSKVGLLDSVMVETFNSFCEKILRQHNYLIYDKPVRVISYKDRAMMVNNALSKIHMDMSKAVDVYFSDAQMKGKTEEQLANIFRNDCFFIRDYFKFKNKKIVESSFETSSVKHEKSVKMVIAVCNYIEAYMRRYGLRDFADQLIDTIAFFKKHKDLIPRFDHILIDEYQDVNSTQIQLVDFLSPENIFCVGDPRQSIYGWRGSDIRYILNFEEKYPDCEIITLRKNYRSTGHIVDLINNSIKNMRLADLQSSIEGKKDINLLKFTSEDEEFEFVIQKIIESDLPRNEIFILARTNRQLNELSQLMKAQGVKHVVRSDEIKKSITSRKNDITLATIHAIKGMEAEMVFVIGCNGINFPCKGSEHPVIEMVKVEEYDKEEEERRLFYVAMSRAKNSLYLTYSGNKPTYFISNSMKKMIEEKEVKVQPKEKAEISIDQSKDMITRLKDLRRKLSKEHNVPAYVIMHDRTLIDIAQKIPRESAELREIYGLGPEKIMKYGEEILKIINA
ncbi:MAG: UvrD-helicase domain-containing protein [Candidatus Thermoplasmatota archaeon]|nr:UvrD-helicase domain-containing protein [Candidatus Thermoplasmatota archaeon]